MPQLVVPSEPQESLWFTDDFLCQQQFVVSYISFYLESSNIVGLSIRLDNLGLLLKILIPRLVPLLISILSLISTP